MKVIYEPKGGAREYAPLAANLYRGCMHGCEYCYAPRVLRMNREDFRYAAAPRRDVLEHLARELKTGEYEGKSIFLSFTTDPYQPIEAEASITRKALELFRAYRVHWNVLTKSALAVRDFDLYRPGDRFGATLVYFSEKESARREPGAFTTKERERALHEAHGMGIDTWVSLEPVIDPLDALALIRRTSYFVNEYKIGKINYVSNETDWYEFARMAKDLLENLGKRYVFKESLKPYLPE